MYGYLHIATSTIAAEEEHLSPMHFTVTVRDWKTDAVLSEIHDPYEKWAVIFHGTMYSWSSDWKKRLPLNQFSQLNPTELVGSISFRGPRMWVRWDQDARVLALTHVKSPLYDEYSKTPFANLHFTAKKPVKAVEAVEA